MKKQIQKGFSLVELMVVIAIIAILAAVAIPMYSNYTTRARLSTALAAVGGAKADVAEAATNRDGLANVQSTDVTSLPSANDSNLAYTTAATNGGEITITFTQPAAGKLMLTPSESSGSITWACTHDSFSDSQVPNGC